MDNAPMPCLLGCLALMAPRVVIILVAIFNLPYFQYAYKTTIWPVLGFFFMPMTTLAYAWAMHYGNGSVQGAGLAVVIFAALLDLGTIGGGASHKKVRRYYVVKRV